MVFLAADVTDLSSLGEELERRSYTCTASNGSCNSDGFGSETTDVVYEKSLFDAMMCDDGDHALKILTAACD